MLHARIVGTGRAVPDQVVTNDDLEKRGIGTTDQWIRERTGIRERHILEAGRATSDLAAEALRNACVAADISPQSLDCIIVATVTPDMPLPSCAVMVQEKLGARGVPSFDLAAACAGFIYGLSVGSSFIRAGQFKRVGVVGVEVLSRVMDWSDRNTCVLFGDGAGAVVLAPNDDDDRGILSTHLYAEGSLTGILNIPAGGTARPTSAETVAANDHVVKMQGKELFKHAVKNIADASLAALQANGLTAEDVTIAVPHQANTRILAAVADRLGIPMSKLYLNIDRYGNTSAASIPIALDEAVRNGKIKERDIVLMAALGAGLAWASACIRW